MAWELPEPPPDDTGGVPPADPSAAQAPAPVPPSTMPPPAPADLASMPDISQLLGPRPVVPMPTPPMPPGAQMDARQQLLHAVAAGLMLGMGPRSGSAVGIGQGLELAQQHADQQKQIAYQQQQVQYQRDAQQAQATQKELDADLQRRGNAVQSTLLKFKTDLAKATTEDQYNQLVSDYSNAFQANGFKTLTPDWFYQHYRFVPPTDQKLLETAVNNAWKLGKDNGIDGPTLLKSSVSYTSPTTKQKVVLPMPEALKQLGLELAMGPDGSPLAAPLGKGSEYEDTTARATAEYALKFGHAPASSDPTANEWITQRAEALRAKPEKPPADYNYQTHTGIVPGYESKGPIQYQLDPRTADVIVGGQNLGPVVVKQPPPASIQVNAAAAVDVGDIAQQVVDGTMAPSMLSKRSASYNATLAKANQLSIQQTGKPIDINKLQNQFNASQAFVRSLNSGQMTRFSVLGNSVVNTINEVKDLADQLQQGGVQKWNQAKRGTILQVYGNTPQSETAARYVAAVNTLKEEFAGLVQGGLAPTESAFGLANSQINADYGVKDLTASLTEVQRLVNFRMSGLQTLGPNLGALGPGPQSTAPTSPVSAPTGSGAPTYQDYLRSRGGR